MSKSWPDLLRGSLPAASLMTWQREALSAALSTDLVVQEAWVLAGMARPGGYPHGACVLVVRLHTEAMHAAGTDEEALADDLRGVFEQELPENCQVLVLTRFTTEPMESLLERRLMA